MKLQRPISTWMKCNPKEMAKMSPAAIQFAFEDAIKDIEKLSRLLCIAIEKAQARYDELRDARDNYDVQTSETKWEIGEATMKLKDAERELKEAELELL